MKQNSGRLVKTVTEPDQIIRQNISVWHGQRAIAAYNRGHYRDFKRHIKMSDRFAK